MPSHCACRQRKSVKTTNTIKITTAKYERNTIVQQQIINFKSKKYKRQVPTTFNDSYKQCRCKSNRNSYKLTLIIDTKSNFEFQRNPTVKSDICGCHVNCQLSSNETRSNNNNNRPPHNLSNLCLSVILLVSILTVQNISGQELKSITNNSQHQDHVRLALTTQQQQQQQKHQQQEKQQLHSIPNVQFMQNSHHNTHKPKKRSFYFNHNSNKSNSVINSYQFYSVINSANSSYNSNIISHKNYSYFSKNSQRLIFVNNNSSKYDRYLFNNTPQLLANQSYFDRKSNNNNNNNNKNNDALMQLPTFDAVVYNDDLTWEPLLDRSTKNEENRQLMKLVMDGLGLQRLPDMRKANISQHEYVIKYREYLRRVDERKRRDIDPQWKEENESLYVLSIAHSSNLTRHLRHRRDLQAITSVPTRSKIHRPNEKTSVILHFPLNIDVSQLKAGDIEEANIRLMLITSPALALKRQGGNRGNSKSKPRKGSPRRPPEDKQQQVPQTHAINMKVYQRLDMGRRLWLDGRKIEITIDRRKNDETHSQWLEFDVTKAVEGWLSNRKTNMGFEVICDNCYRYGARIIDDLSDTDRISEASGLVNDKIDDEDFIDEANEKSESDNSESGKFDLTPMLNIIGRLGNTHHERRSRKRSASATQHHHTVMGGSKSSKGHTRKTNCYKDNQRCCRHTMKVVFKDIKGFEFIIQPKVFDAGYCRGRCPPRYNPAHHHAMLQSLIWKQNRTHVPRTCCAPSKLVELEVLHVDEKNSDKLKISTWTDMRVIECACS